MSNVSELILNNGLFSPVWIAGTMKDKLGKKVVLSTDIADIAEKIMKENRINLVLRLSGMLLKGLVVVYSKKTQYMLNDCNDIITKIMQSFKTNAVNLPSTMKSSDAITISINTSTKTAEIANGDINEWLQTGNPEEEFIVKQPLDFPTPSEASQLNTQLSDSSSLSSTPSSQALFSDTFNEPMQPPQPAGQDFEPLPMPQWDTDEPVPVFDEIDEGPVDEPIHGQPEERYETETETETDADNEKDKQKSRIVDSQIDLPNVRGQNRRKARAPAAKKKRAALPQNEELEELFDLAKQEFNKPPEQNEIDLDNSDLAFPPEDFRNPDALPDNESDIPDQPFVSDNDEEPDRRISLPSTPNDYLDITRKNRFSAEQTPSSVKLISPYPNIQFAIEKTPRRSVEDSITNETISVLNKVTQGLKDTESITFNQAFSGSRHEIASAFYQLLVLRSTGYTINIEQEKPYDQINILPGTAFPTS